MQRPFRRGRRAALDWRALFLEALGSLDLGPCPDCGDMTRRVWGVVHTPGAVLAAYFVDWTPGRPGHDANFDLVIGRWGEQATPPERQAVSLVYRAGSGQGAFMVVDAASRPTATPLLVGTALRRDQVIGQPIAAEVFAIADAVLAMDERLAEIRGWRGGQA